MHRLIVKHANATAFRLIRKGWRDGSIVHEPNAYLADYDALEKQLGRPVTVEETLWLERRIREIADG